MSASEINSTEALLREIESAAEDQERVSIETLLDYIGRRSFGPIILAVGAFLAIPGLSDIPTVPTIFGSLIVLVGVQILFGREKIWMPQWLLNRSVKAERVRTAANKLKKPASHADKILKRRLSFLTTGIGSTLVATTCVLLALLTPVMEIIPLSANVAGIALTFFGLGLVGRDGLMNAIGFSFCTLLTGIAIYFFFF